MEISIPYGDKQIPIDIPNEHLQGVLAPNPVGELRSEGEIITYALQHPIQSRPLEEIVTAGDRLVVIIPDKTRCSRLEFVLPILLERLHLLGVQSENILFLFANGSHGAMTTAEKRTLLGETIFSTYHHEEHDCHRSETVYLGSTTRGTPVYVNQLVRSDRKILVVNSIVHHYFAGFGGGPKMIVPGVAGFQTILSNHRYTVSTPDGILHPHCRPGNLEGNPVYQDILQAVNLVDVHFSLQVVLDSGHRIVGAFAGDLIAAFQQGCTLVEKMNCVHIPEPADLVIVGCGGSPKDINLIQAHKAIHHAFQALKPNGVLIAFAECSDGVGSQTFLLWFDYPTLTEMKKAVMANYQLNGNTALALKEKLQRAHILLISNLERGISQRIGFVATENFVQAWEKARKLLPENFSVYVIPDGSITLPMVKR